MPPLRVAHVSFAPGASHLQLQLRLRDDRKTFFRLCDEKLERVRYRLQLLASDVPTGDSKKKKKRKNGVSGGPTPSVSVQFLDAEDEEINAKTTTVGDALMRTRNLQIGAERFVVLHNQPIVTKLKVLEPVMTGIAVIPLPETEFCTADECSWRWFRLDEDEKKILVATARRYTPMQEELGCRFHIECHAPIMKSEFAEDSKAEIVTTPVQLGPNRDVFKERKAMGLTSAADKYTDAVDAFRVMSYNILYDGYATTEHAQKNLFPYVDASVMKETRRIQLIFHEIEENNSDIVCLQEMGEHVYNKFFNPMLISIGYRGFYSGKTGTTNEGCAIFVRMERFEVVSEDTINLGTAVQNSTDSAAQSLLQDYPEIAKAINRIPSIAQVVILRSIFDPSKKIILSNTHLFYRGDAHLIRLLQGAAVVDHVSQRKAELGFEDAAVVLCGDWNAHPRAALVAFLLDGQIDSSHKHWQLAPSFRWNLSKIDDKSIERQTAKVSSNHFKHSLQLVSACGVPTFTNYVSTFVDTLDYIMVGAKELQVLDVFPFFTEEQVTHEVALPSSTFPSDHVALVCDLSWV